MELHVIPAVIILVLNFHTPVTFDDSSLIKSDASLSCERGAACPANGFCSVYLLSNPSFNCVCFICAFENL